MWHNYIGQSKLGEVMSLRHALKDGKWTALVILTVSRNHASEGAVRALEMFQGLGHLEGQVMYFWEGNNAI